MIKLECLQIVEQQLPHAPDYYRKLIAAWLDKHKQLCNADNIRHVYRYILGKETYSELCNHFGLEISNDPWELII